jgi:DNA-3-methyladenine glycosylase I
MATPTVTTLAEGAGWSSSGDARGRWQAAIAQPRSASPTENRFGEVTAPRYSAPVAPVTACKPGNRPPDDPIRMTRPVQRCAWVSEDPLYIRYHDEEWGIPVHDDRMLFEFLVLEGAQAGLSWLTILRKRPNYVRAFDGFDVRKIARYGEARVAKLMADEGIVRNRLKIESTISNAKAVLELERSGSSLDALVWSFVGGAPRVNRPAALTQVPAKTPESDALSKELKARGFRFVGSTIIYAFMQACGLVDDHQRTCFRARPGR